MERPEIQATLSGFDSFAFFALAIVVPSELRDTQEGAEQAYVIARHMMQARATYEGIVRMEEEAQSKQKK